MKSGENLSTLMDQFAHQSTQSVHKGEVIYASDTTNLRLFYVTSGYVKRYMIRNDGSLGVQSIYGPGDSFPLTPVFKALLGKSIYTGPEIHYYETMCGTELTSIPVEELKRLAEQNQDVYKDLLIISANRLTFNIQQLENLGLATFYNRVAHQLVFFARKFGEKTQEGTKILVPVTQQDIANTLGATRETVSICIAQLRKNGLIDTRTDLIVKDVEKLENEAFQ